MIKSTVRLTVGILNIVPFWRNFIFLLIILNGILPWFLLGKPVAGWVLAGFYLGAILMSMLTYLFGFVRLLGLAHVAWLPFMFLLWGRAGNVPFNDFYGIWFWATLLVNSFALLLDAWDVLRYLRGDKEEMVEGLDRRIQDWGLEFRG